MDWQDEYERKKITVNQVFEQHLTGNQKIYTGGLHVPTTIINALIDRVATGALTGIDLYGNWMNGDITFAGLDVTPEQFRYHTYFAGPNERTGFANGSRCVAHIPVHFSDTNRMLEEVGLDYAVVQMTPPKAIATLDPWDSNRAHCVAQSTSLRRSIHAFPAYSATRTATT